ncbi:MAG: hypothetical protein IAE88_09500 [Rhodobacteraceae bacterium]|nr:hypothetical protein [Paracoccaceae bacterium]
MTTNEDRVFKAPEKLSDESEILGIKAVDWDRAILGNMAEELRGMKDRVFKAPEPMQDDSPTGINGVSAKQLFDSLTGSLDATLNEQAARRDEIDGTTPKE